MVLNDQVSNILKSFIAGLLNISAVRIQEPILLDNLANSVQKYQKFMLSRIYRDSTKSPQRFTSCMADRFSQSSLELSAINVQI